MIGTIIFISVELSLLPKYIADWINDGHLSLNDEIPDLVASSSSASDVPIPMITVRQALLKYREVRAYQLSHDSEGNDQFLSAYSTPAYTSLPTFLTM